MRESEILQALDRIWERSNVRTALHGRLGKENGTVEEIEVRGRPGYVYVSMGEQGNQGMNIAKDNVGTARTVFQLVKMRRELGELVIYEASAYAGGTGNGGGPTEPGVTSFFDLEEVDPNDWDNGEVPTWDVATGTFKPLLPGGYGEGGGAYAPGDGIQFSGNVINAKPNVNRAIVVDSTGIGVKADDEGGLAAYQNGDGLYIFRKTNSGLNLADTGISVGEGMGINVIGDIINVDVTDLHDPLMGLTETGNQLQIQLGIGVANGGTDAGLLFTAAGALVVGKGDGIDVNFDNVAVKANELVGQGLTTDGSNNFKVLFSDTPLAGMGYGSNNGIYIGEGPGIDVLAGSIQVKLSSIEPDGMTFDADGGLYIGDGDGIKVNEGNVAVDVVELISPFVYGMEHDGLNNFAVALEANSGLRFNASSGRLELGAPGDLDVYTTSILIDDTHYHHVATSSDPGPNEAIMATDIYGGFIFDDTLLIVDAANDRVGINTIPENLVGAAALDVLVDNLDDITQRLRQKENQRGRIWRVEDYTGQELIVLDSVGNLQSGNPGFVSGLTGWQISHTGNAEFNNIWARGELHATVFVKDEIHATGGTFMVATAATFWEDATVTNIGIGESEFFVDTNPTGALGFGPLEIVTTSPTFEGTTLNSFSAGNYIKLNHPPSGPATYFQPGEILRVKTEVDDGSPLRLADVWLVVNQGDASNEEYGLYSVTKTSGSDCTIPKGTAIVTYGRPGDGAILMTSDWRPASNDDGYAPYIDIFTTGEEPWTGLNGAIIPHVRLGQLKGVGLPGVSGINKFGLIAGTDLSDANSSYMMASSDGVEIYRGVIRLHNGANLTGEWDQDGNFKLGKNVGQEATTGFEVVTTAGDPEEGDVWIGDREGTNYIHWDASEGTLLVTGSLQIGGGSGDATTAYVDQAEEDAVRRAGEYTDSEIADIQGANNSYADSRRMIAVDGTWASSAYNKVSWTSAKAYFANNTTRTITNSAAGGVTLPVGRTYLYVDLNQAGNLTVIPVQNAASLIQASYVVIAVADVGTSAANAARASINVIVGSTYITGANIFTGSILASNIASNAIDTGWLAAGAVTANEIDVNTLATINGTKIQRIEGVMIPAPRPPTGPTNVVSWGGVGNNLRVTLASGVVITVTAGSREITQLEYAYVLNRTTPATVAMQWYDPNEPGIDSLPGNAVIIAVCQRGPEAAGVVMVTGGVIISGGNIVSDSITATQIKARSLSADLIVSGSLTENELDPAFVAGLADDAAAAAITETASLIDKSTIVGMGGRIVPDASIPTPVVGRFSWPTMSIKYKSGDYSTLTGGTYNMVSTSPTARVFFSIDPDLATDTLEADEVITAVPVGNIIIAVGERQTIASSCSMVYGGVVISGNSIVAGSITGILIQAETITADHVDANFFTASQNTAAGQATAEIYGNTIVSCSGTLVADPDTNGKITWGQFVIRFANNTTRTVPASTGSYFHTVSPVGAKGYFYVIPGEPAATPLWGTTTSTSVPATAVIIGVAERGETHTSVKMTYGGTIISGNHIMTQSITAGEIKAGTITANELATGSVTAVKINVANLEAVKAFTGDLTVDGFLKLNSSAAKIYSSTKSTADSAVAGFFLGWDTAGTDAYKFSVGDASSYLKWDGTKFVSKFDYPLTFIPTANQNNAIFTVQNLTDNPTKTGYLSMSFDSSTVGTWFTDKFWATNFVRTGQLWIEGTASAFDALKFDATLFSVRYQNRMRYTMSSGLLDWDGPFYAADGITIGANLDVGGNVIRLRTRTDDLDHSYNPGSIGDIRWGSHAGSDYLYVCFGTNNWRRVLMGGTW